jgi:hypothetical protein
VGLTTLRIFQTLSQKFRGKRRPTGWGRYLSIFVTFQFVCLTWIFFRSPDVATALSILGRLSSFTFSLNNVSFSMISVMLFGIALHAIPPKWFDRSVEIFGRAPFVIQGAGLASVALLIQFLSGRGSTSFVYSNF